LRIYFNTIEALDIFIASNLNFEAILNFKVYLIILASYSLIRVQISYSGRAYPG